MNEMSGLAVNRLMPLAPTAEKIAAENESKFSTYMRRPVIGDAKVKRCSAPGLIGCIEIPSVLAGSANPAFQELPAKEPVVMLTNPPPAIPCPAIPTPSRTPLAELELKLVRSVDVCAIALVAEQATTAAATRIAGQKDEVRLEVNERARERIGTRELHS